MGLLKKTELEGFQ
jgi:hypothetical protein